MKLKPFVWQFFAFSLLFVPSLAMADVIQGSISRTTPSGIDMTVVDEQGRPYPNGLHLKVDRRTHLNGIPTSALLRTRDFVKVDVRQENDGTWRADSITKLGTTTSAPQQGYAAPAGPSLGSQLMDALKSPTGQKYLRSGLEGAAVGGVAAYASGGKGGKGALLGAGLGAAATFIGDLLNQPRPAQQPAQYYDNRTVQG